MQSRMNSQKNRFSKFNLMQMSGKVLTASSGIKVRIYVAVCATMFMLLSTYIGDYMPHHFGNDELTMKQLHLVELAIGKSKHNVPDNILPVNIGYDRQLTDFFDEYGIPCGVIDVTDRNKLLEFLTKIRESQYAAIALDVFFDGDITADGDSALFACINEMPRLVVPIHSDKCINQAIHFDKFANGDYMINMTSGNFTKYKFGGEDEIPSIAARLYRFADEDSVYFNYDLTDATIILPLSIGINTSYMEDGTKVWYNLGSDLLDIYSDQELSNLVKGKTIVIGDYCINDQHDSYIGSISGPGIIINALHALRMEKTKRNILSVIITSLVYILLAGGLIFNVSISRFFHLKQRPFLNFLLSFVGYGFLLWLLQALQFSLFSEFHDTLFVTLFLSLYSIYCQKLNEKYPFQYSNKVTN